MIISHGKMSLLEEFLPESSCIRTHESFIVAKNKIKQIEGNRIFINEHKIPIGQTYKGNVDKLF